MYFVTNKQNQKVCWEQLKNQNTTYNTVEHKVDAMSVCLDWFQCSVF